MAYRLLFTSMKSCKYKISFSYRKYSILNNIKSKIEMTGPMTIADYMKEVLTNPKSGYYMKKDVFGRKGDFITSPEISQLFGEILAIWTITEWQKLGAPVPCQLIELGPGRGTLMQDILRVFRKLNLLQNPKNFSIHFVEVSRAMGTIQGNNLCDSHKIEIVNELHENNLGCYQRGLTAQTSIPIYWYSDLRFVPKIFSLIIAHEFFDALPIHKFQKVGNEWKEILIGTSGENSSELSFVISKSPTAASIFLTKDEDKRTHFEVSPQAGIIIQQLGERLEKKGGFAIVIDYGHDGNKTDTFRAFKQHCLHDPLKEPGTADLTADVDFSYLRKVAADKLISIGPVSQRQFLANMHIDARLKMLVEHCNSKEEKDNLLSGYHMLMDENQMGKRFQIMSLFPLVLSEFLQSFPVAGFSKQKN